jgi:DNA-binding transcriptional regulator YhcF (GntR family)
MTSLELKVEPASAVPLWHQIERGFTRLLAAGSLRPGAKVPSVRDLAGHLRVNPATVAKAYQVLTDAGLLEVRRGEGTFAREIKPTAGARERREGLREAAARYAGAARGLGATEEQALKEVRSAWPRQEEER